MGFGLVLSKTVKSCNTQIMRDMESDPYCDIIITESSPHAFHQKCSIYSTPILGY